jgi:streptogramin lyase
VWFLVPFSPYDVVVYDPATHNWQALISDTAYHIDAARVFTDGQVWRATFNRTASASLPNPLPEGWTFSEQHTFVADELQLLPDAVRHIHAATIDSHNHLWINNTAGVSSLDLATDTWTTYDRTTPEALQREHGTAITVSSDGAVWVASGSDYPHVFRLDPPMGRWRSYTPRDGLPNTQGIEHMTIDRAGNLWFGFGAVELLTHCTPN